MVQLGYDFGPGGEFPSPPMMYGSYQFILGYTTVISVMKYENNQRPSVVINEQLKSHPW